MYLGDSRHSALKYVQPLDESMNLVIVYCNFVAAESVVDAACSVLRRAQVSGSVAIVLCPATHFSRECNRHHDLIH